MTRDEKNLYNRMVLKKNQLKIYKCKNTKTYLALKLDVIVSEHGFWSELLFHKE